MPATQQPLLSHARLVVEDARVRGAPVKEAHLDKAQVHTWLAWQDPPGLQMHQALIANVLQTTNPAARTFTEWFIKLFQLDDLRRPAKSP